MSQVGAVSRADGAPGIHRTAGARRGRIIAHAGSPVSPAVRLFQIELVQKYAGQLDLTCPYPPSK